MDRERFVQNQITKFRKEFKIRKSVEIIKDNRIGYKIMGIRIYRYTDNNELFYLIKCNFKILNQFTKIQIIHTLLHEFGHIKSGHVGLDDKRCKLPLATKEYQAEKFAMLYLKEHYSKYYPKALKELRDFKNNRYKDHQKACERLWEELK